MQFARPLLIAVCLCALALATPTSMKKPAERPSKDCVEFEADRPIGEAPNSLGWGKTIF